MGDSGGPDGFVTTIWRKSSKTAVVTGEVTGEVSEEIERIILLIEKEMKCVEVQHALGLRHEDRFREVYLFYYNCVYA
jgi:ATP-dependent DNA helicase RecG